MISLILPYWNRWDAACEALLSIGKAYRGMDLEIVIVDDGSTAPRFETPAIAFPEGMTIKIVRLPEKTEPKSPVTCWNEGVKAASGDIIAISCVEVLHFRPVLAEMAAQLDELGPQGYVLAAAWCPELQEWHCHSEKGSEGAYALPKGTGRAFLGMMRRSLYEKAGGWDEDYRDGAGYEDVDFVYRMLLAGAKFCIRDDLVVTHPKRGASIAWGAEKFERNRALLEKKWRKVTIVCVQARNYCGMGAEYVNRLYDMVTRNLPRGILARFVCLTDDPAGLDAGVEAMALPSDLEGWYGKLYLFKPGLFADGERVIFFDLDTVILGRLDGLVQYDGDFAVLRDFYEPSQVGPAVMSWRAGKASRIWTEWEAADKPRLSMGDLEWINGLEFGEFARRADKLQDILPGDFASYKRDCKNGLPEHVKVVCFHGRPRPHEVRDEWVLHAWKVGGLQPADLEFVINVHRSKVAQNIAHSCGLNLPWLECGAPRSGAALVVGGAPSVKTMLPEIRTMVKAGAVVFAVNGVADLLTKQGIAVDYQVIIDARPENAGFVCPEAKHYLLASQCDPTLFERVDLTRATLVHMHTAEIEKQIPEGIKPVTLISSGTTVGLAALALSYALGWRVQYLYGMDSSYEGDAHHAYQQPGNDADPVIEAIVGGRKFKTTPWMVEQVNNFQKLAAELANDGCEIHVRSFGMLGQVAWLMTQQQAAA